MARMPLAAVKPGVARRRAMSIAACAAQRPPALPARARSYTAASRPPRRALAPRAAAPAPDATTTTSAPSTSAAPVGSAPGPAAPCRLQAVLQGLDELNSQDPRSVEVDGQQVPYELAYSRWLSCWVLALCADAGRQAGEELLITARGQHVERWKVPRASYPEGRAAYLQWREDLKKQHAATTTRLMAAAGYDTDSCKRVEQLIMKRALKEAEGQIVEDALCLVFLERQLAEFLPKLLAGGEAAAAEAKMVDILQKSWKKMGPLGRAAALRLPLGPREAALVGRALAPAAEPAAEEQQ